MLLTTTPLPTLGAPVELHGGWLFAILVLVPFLPPF